MIAQSALLGNDSVHVGSGGVEKVAIAQLEAPLVAIRRSWRNACSRRKLGRADVLMNRRLLFVAKNWFLGIALHSTSKPKQNHSLLRRGVKLEEAR